MQCEKKNPRKFKKGILFTFVMLLGFTSSGRSHAQNDLNQLRTMWRNGDYSQVIRLLFEYRERPYGRNAEVDYMIATSACRLPTFQDVGHKWFRWILSHYSLDDRSRAIVENEMQQCASTTQPNQIVFVTQRSGGGVAGVRGKTFYWLDAENASITSDPVEVIRDLTREELTSRLFKASERDAGIMHIKNLAGPPFQIVSRDHFILASTSIQAQAELLNLAGNLETVLRFFTTQYSIPIPDYLITIYLVPVEWKLQELAEQIHGIRVSETSIGYSFQDDLSIVGVIPNSQVTGTLRHELFHLMVRNKFGDIPPWMDEGMAALYEVSQIIGDRVIGVQNWRGPVLKRFWELRPSIEELVIMDWRAFNNEAGDYEAKQQATNHALARYFVLYLQEKQKLVAVHNAFRDREVRNMQVSPGSDAVRLLETILQRPLSDVDKDFSVWFNGPVVTEPKDPPAPSSGQALWRVRENGRWWFFLNGKSLVVPEDIEYEQTGDDLLVYVKDSKQYYLMPDYINKWDMNLHPAELIPSPNQTLWRAQANGNWWFFLNGKSLKVPNDLEHSSTGDDLLVYVKATRQYYLMKDYVNRFDDKLRPAETVANSRSRP